jgi:hypothetical protein
VPHQEAVQGTLGFLPRGCIGLVKEAAHLRVRVELVELIEVGCGNRAQVQAPCLNRRA